MKGTFGTLIRWALSAGAIGEAGATGLDFGLKGHLLRQGGWLIMLVGLITAGPVWADLRAGVSRIDLTPPAEMKASLGGYGARMSQPAEGVHDRVWVKALVFDDGTKRFALVTADMLGFPPGVKKAVLERLEGKGWQRENVLLLPSHTHTSIDLMAIHPKNRFPIPQIGLFQQALFDWVVERLAQVIADAEQEMTPVRVGTGRIPLEGWNRNRREGNTFTDPDLTVTRVDRTDGSPLAVLVNWTAHPTLMSAEDMLFSGGWPGHLQRTLEALIGQGVTALYYNGAQGDQSPVSRGPAGSNWERAEQYGLELGVQAWRLWQTIQPRRESTLAYHLGKIELPQRTWHPDFMKTGGAEYGLSKAFIGTLLKALFPTETASLAFRLGDLVIVGIPGELAGALGMELKRKASEATGARYAVIGGLANEWVSYILSPEEYLKGGYEASMSFYGSQLAPRIMEAAQRGVIALATSSE